MATPTWTAFVTQATGHLVTAAEINNYWGGNANHLATPCSAQAVWSANTVVATATYVDVAWGAENYDTDAIHDITTNNNRLLIPAGLGGRYLVTGYVQFAANATGARVVRWRKNGATAGAELVRIPATAAGVCIVPFTDEVVLVAGDYLTIQAWQDSGGNLNVTGGQVSIRKISN